MQTRKHLVSVLCTAASCALLASGCGLQRSPLVRAELGSSRERDRTGLAAELHAMRSDERPEPAERLHGNAPGAGWGPRPFEPALVGPTDAVDAARRSLLDRALEDADPATRLTLERIRAELERDRLEVALAPARPLLGPRRGFPRRAVLHLLFGHGLATSEASARWVLRLEALVAALEAAPAPPLSVAAPTPTAARAWTSLGSEALSELLLERFDAGTRLVPDLDRSTRRDLLRRAEALLEGPLQAGLEEAASLGIDPGAATIRGLSLQLGGLTLHRDRAAALVRRPFELRGLAEAWEQRLRLVDEALAAAAPPADAASHQETLAAALGPEALNLAEGLAEVPRPAALAELLEEPLSLGLTRGARPRLRVVVPAPAGSRSFRQEQALLEVLALETARVLREDAPAWLLEAHWPGWEAAVAVLLQQAAGQEADALRAERELLARGRMDLGLHRERWSREEAVRFLEERMDAPRREAEWWVDLALDEPALLLAPVAYLEDLRGLGESLGWTLGSGERAQRFLRAVLLAGPAPLELLDAAVLEQL